jgi:hypothetical protein
VWKRVFSQTGATCVFDKHFDTFRLWRKHCGHFPKKNERTPHLAFSEQKRVYKKDLRVCGEKGEAFVLSLN